MKMRRTPELLKPRPLCRRLWQGAIALLLLVATLVVGNLYVEKDKSVTLTMLGHDFLPFYTAGTFAAEGRYRELYNLETVKQFQHVVAQLNGLELGKSFGPWWNPPFYAWAFAPLAKLPYPQALGTWIVINAMCLLVSFVLLIDMLPKAWFADAQQDGSAWRPMARDWRTTLLIPLLIAMSMPCLQALSHAQNTCTSLLLICLTVTAWRNQKPILAGLVGGLLFYKPQLALVISAVMVFSMGWRVLIGLGITGFALAAATEYSMPGAISLYVSQLPINVHIQQVEQTYLWERHVTLKALFRMMLQGREAGEATMLVKGLTFSASLLLAGLLLRAILSQRRRFDDPWTGETSAVARDRLIAATITVSPLLMPFYFDYDLLLLSVPAVLLGSEILQRDEERNAPERWLTRTWCLMYFWMMFNSAIAGKIEINITTILLSLTAVQMLVRAGRQPISLAVDSIHDCIPTRAPLRAAA